MKFVSKFLLLPLFTVVIVAAVWQYLFCPQLIFTKLTSFSGNKWYNPYAGLSCGNWVKCNFHAHTKAWGGITNGNAIAKDVWRVYNDMGYAVHCISDYQTINTDFSEEYNF